MKNERVVIYIDGGNTYRKIKNLRLPEKGKRFDFSAFASYLLGGRKLISKRYYIGQVRNTDGTAKGEELVRKQQIFLATLRVAGFSVQLGKIMYDADRIREKGVDVKLAIDVVIDASEDIYDTAIIVSSDTDLIPALHYAMRNGKRIEYIGFSGSPSYGMTQESTIQRILPRIDLLLFQYDKSAARRVYSTHMANGRLHPLTASIREIADIFGRMGFGIAAGPELEDEWHNFTALRIPEDHPARDMQDTFWTKERPARVPRTHTSPTQIRHMQEQMEKSVLPPYRIIVPGKVFRNEATDATHEAQFYQCEGLAVGEGVTLAHLKGTVEQFSKEYFGESAQVRFRPSYFSFTEPSVEVDVWYEAPGKPGKWLEVMGAGMVHPEVLRNAGVDPEKYQGFAFGVGIERLVMIKHGVSDIRGFHSGDIRFVHAFDTTVQ